MYIGGGTCIEAAGGRANKVIYSPLNKHFENEDYLGCGRVPLEDAEDSFYNFIKQFPKK